MTYNDLLQEIKTMTPAQRRSTVTVQDKKMDEFYPVPYMTYCDSDEIDVLDADHPYLVVKTER